MLSYEYDEVDKNSENLIEICHSVQPPISDLLMAALSFWGLFILEIIEMNQYYEINEIFFFFFVF